MEFICEQWEYKRLQKPFKCHKVFGHMDVLCWVSLLSFSVSASGFFFSWRWLLAIVITCVVLFLTLIAEALWELVGLHFGHGKDEWGEWYWLKGYSQVILLMLFRALVHISRRLTMIPDRDFVWLSTDGIVYQLPLQNVFSPLNPGQKGAVYNFNENRLVLSGSLFICCLAKCCRRGCPCLSDLIELVML